MELPGNTRRAKSLRVSREGVGDRGRSGDGSLKLPEGEGEFCDEVFELLVLPGLISFAGSLLAVEAEDTEELDGDDSLLVSVAFETLLETFEERLLLLTECARDVTLVGNTSEGVYSRAACSSSSSIRNHDRSESGGTLACKKPLLAKGDSIVLPKDLSLGLEEMELSGRCDCLSRASPTTKFPARFIRRLVFLPFREETSDAVCVRFRP